MPIESNEPDTKELEAAIDKIVGHVRTFDSRTMMENDFKILKTYYNLLAHNVQCDSSSFLLQKIEQLKELIVIKLLEGVWPGHMHLENPAERTLNSMFDSIEEGGIQNSPEDLTETLLLIASGNNPSVMALLPLASQKSRASHHPNLVSKIHMVAAMKILLGNLYRLSPDTDNGREAELRANGFSEQAIAAAKATDRKLLADVLGIIIDLWISSASKPRDYAQAVSDSIGLLSSQCKLNFDQKGWARADCMFEIAEVLCSKIEELLGGNLQKARPFALLELARAVAAVAQKLGFALYNPLSSERGSNSKNPWGPEVVQKAEALFARMVQTLQTETLASAMKSDSSLEGIVKELSEDLASKNFGKDRIRRPVAVHRPRSQRDQHNTAK